MLFGLAAAVITFGIGWLIGVNLAGQVDGLVELKSTLGQIRNGFDPQENEEERMRFEDEPRSQRKVAYRSQVNWRCCVAQLAP